jgi:hypothetical protein
MSKRGRRNRAKNAAKKATAPVGAGVAARVLPPVEPAPLEHDASTAPPVTALPPEAPAELEPESEPSPESGSDDVTVPPVGDLDARFFEEVSTEDWLAHELDLRDPRFVRKMTDRVAQRRARFARYVAGVVGIAAALCVAALVKSAVPASADEEWSSRPAARMAMPPGPMRAGPEGRTRPHDGGGPRRRRPRLTCRRSGGWARDSAPVQTRPRKGARPLTVRNVAGR